MCSEMARPLHVRKAAVKPVITRVYAKEVIAADMTLLQNGCLGVICMPGHTETLGKCHIPCKKKGRA